jgi:hypothetical protein
VAPVEWTVISGEQAEDVLSNLLYSEHTNAVRVRPSQGDLGIDVLVPVDATGEPFDVYQIKKFANTLSRGRSVVPELSKVLAESPQRPVTGIFGQHSGRTPQYA